MVLIVDRSAMLLLAEVDSATPVVLMDREMEVERSPRTDVSVDNEAVKLDTADATEVEIPPIRAREAVAADVAEEMREARFPIGIV